MPTKELRYIVKEIGEKYHVAWKRTSKSTGYIFDSPERASKFVDYLNGYPFKSPERGH